MKFNLSMHPCSPRIYCQDYTLRGMKSTEEHCCFSLALTLFSNGLTQDGVNTISQKIAANK
ncbi:hypothetical protein T07_4635 [Trichinella nelsoni]|uniref:Uncharacterized protein n=1 Tax=Trichinella nelsoni TaxID=6336 RepID=A0A0V0RPR8_9BILA|nr:hypothetical protein T07_4635 [Trichinella nelsoni]